MIQVMLFARLAEVAGKAVVTLTTEKKRITVRDVKSLLVDRFPALKEPLDQSMAAVNQEYAGLDEEVVSTDEIAFIPPVSGG